MQGVRVEGERCKGRNERCKGWGKDVGDGMRFKDIRKM